MQFAVQVHGVYFGTYSAEELPFYLEIEKLLLTHGIEPVRNLAQMLSCVPGQYESAPRVVLCNDIVVRMLLIAEHLGIT